MATATELFVETYGLSATARGFVVPAQAITHICFRMVVVSVQTQIGGAEHTVGDAE